MPTSPAFVYNTAINTGNNTNTRTIYYPTIIDPGNIIILQVQAEGSTYDINTPTGWNLITSWTQGGDSYGAWFWKRLNGTEVTGSETITRSSSSGLFSLVPSEWKYCAQTGTPFETVALSQGTSNSASSTAITPTKNNCTVICFISVEDNVSIATLNGGNYIEKYEVTSGTGNGCAFSCDSFTQVSAATEAARTAALGGTDNWCCLTMAMYPISSVDKINNVALASFAQISGV